MAIHTFFAHKLVSLRPTNYIVLGYEPARRNRLGVTRTAYGNTFAAPALHREYALKDTGKEYILNLAGLKEALIRYEKKGHPVRFMGFPAYFMFLLQELRASNMKFRLHPKSLVMLAGGWKQFFSEQVDKHILYEMAEEQLGIGEDRFQEFFGAVEHPIIYADCPRHHFHVPIYSRVIIRDHDLKPLPYGKPGMLNLLTPMISSMPLCSVMTDDLAMLYPGEQCGCGNPAPYFKILGRAGFSDIKTCATAYCGRERRRPACVFRFGRDPHWKYQHFKASGCRRGRLYTNIAGTDLDGTDVSGVHLCIRLLIERCDPY